MDHFPLFKLPKELIFEVFSHLPQKERLNICLISKECYSIAVRLIYRKIYLNDSNVVKSDYMDLAINWTLLYIPSSLKEDQSRSLANYKLERLIKTLKANNKALNSISWIRINWDLNPKLQKDLLILICNHSGSLKRLENITDPSCNDIIANGYESSTSLISFDMAPPNALPDQPVSNNYIQNLGRYLSQRISSKLSHMTLFMDPIQLFNQIYPLKTKLQITDLKLHWRREFYPQFNISLDGSIKLLKLYDFFDIRTLKILTIISWNETLSPRDLEMLREFSHFVNIEDLSLISIKQNSLVLQELFKNLVNLKRLKMDFLKDFIPQSTKTDIFLTILYHCKNLQFIDIRYENLDEPIISISNNLFEVIQKCYCHHCQYVFKNIIYGKIFATPIDFNLKDINDLMAKDIFTMMRYFSLLPYSKACDTYPSVRTQPMDMNQFVSIMNENLINYRHSRGEVGIHDIPLITTQDVIDCYHSILHHYKITYLTFLTEFRRLRFLMLNDIPTIIVEENGERIPQPVFYNKGYKSNLYGWEKKWKSQKDSNNITRQMTIC